MLQFHRLAAISYDINMGSKRSRAEIETIAQHKLSLLNSTKSLRKSDAADQCGTRAIEFNPQRNAKIIGGIATPYGSYPWQVEIQMFRYDGMRFEHHCGGAVVGEHLVLTAAHCIQVNILKFQQKTVNNLLFVFALT